MQRMHRKQKDVSAGMSFAVMLILLTAIALEQGLIESPKWYYVLWVTIPMLAIYAWLFRKSSMDEKTRGWYSITKDQQQ
ncbi:MAG TPA: hypothetical protein VM187_12350 [Niastella sp.]|nr:hypothetical protein [Niastella sp.]